MSNMVRAIMQWKAVNQSVVDSGVSYELVDNNDNIIQRIVGMAKARSNGIEIHAKEEITKGEGISLIVNAMKMKDIVNVYCSLGQLEKPYIIKLDIPNLEYFLNIEYLDSKAVTIYSVRLDGCCIVDLPTVGAMDFGIVLFGSFGELNNEIRDSLAMLRNSHRSGRLP